MNLPDPTRLRGSWLRRTTTRRTPLCNSVYIAPLLLLGPETASIVRSGNKLVTLPALPQRTASPSSPA
jgi:hypothetical protein